MKNIPGTLLFVRRTFKNKNSSVTPGYITVYSNTGGSHMLTYGDPCLMLSYEAIDSKMSPKIFSLTILVNKNIYTTSIKNRECNKWFATDKQWETNKYDETYKKFLSNGDLPRLWRLYGLTDRLDNSL